MTRKQLIERWEQGYRVLEALTPHERTHHFNMRTWVRQTQCGTQACMVGWFAQDTWFKRRGVRLHWNPVIQSAGLVTWKENFFGNRGSLMFYDTDIETVDDALKEIKYHIEWLKNATTDELYDETHI
jgi:hypothetical protein